MAEPNTVETIEVCSVAPAVQVSSSVPKSLPLTFFDLHWLRLGIFQRLFFYEMSTPEAFFHSNILPRLEQSLSLALGHFLPIAGKLTWPLDSPKPVLTYSPGDAVSLTVARSQADFSLLTATDNVVCDLTTYNPLMPNLSASPESSAVIAIQLTVFPNHGFSIGLAMHHAVLDGESSVLFMKSWAHICRSLEAGRGDIHHHHHHQQQQSPGFFPADLEPSFDRTLVNDPANLEAIFLNQWLNFEGSSRRSLLPLQRYVPPDLFRGTFHLPQEKLEKLRRLVKVNNNDQQEPRLHVSTFSLTCAYTWICLLKAEGIKDKKVFLCFPANCRSRLQPPLPRTYFGNCVATRYVAAEAALLLGKEGFSAAVNAIGEAIKKLDNGVLEGAENWVSGLIGSAGTPAPGRVFPVVSSHRFGFYSIDFGWGRPRKVDRIAKHKTGMIYLSDRRNGDAGVEIGLVLERHQMEAFASLFVQGLESL